MVERRSRVRRSLRIFLRRTYKINGLRVNPLESTNFSNGRDHGDRWGQTFEHMPTITDEDVPRIENL